MLIKNVTRLFPCQYARGIKYYTSGGATRSNFNWFWIPASLGVACLGVVKFVRVLKRERENPASPHPMTWQLTGFLMIPSRPLSRGWGTLMSTQIPSILRRPLLGLYTLVFGCNLKESERENLSDYQSFTDLFTRQLKDGVRHIDQIHQMICPCDGKVLHFGTIEEDFIEEVKGINYSLSAFLGPQIFQSSSKDSNKLYHVVVYLGPGDCHHFYSPSKWTPHINRHIPGELLTVAPWAAKSMPGLFALNERVILSGEWEHGYFSFSAIGAYNVGSINLTFDKELITNQKGHYKYGHYTDRQLDNFSVDKGDHLGYFNMGSSIVLIFEAPNNFQFVVNPGQAIKIGQPLGKIS